MMTQSSPRRPASTPGPSLILLVPLLFGLLSGCGTMRKIKDIVPEIPEIVLIGEREPKVEELGDPTILKPDFEKDAAVFVFDYLGQSRRVVIQLFPQDAPVHVANFQKLARDDYYEDMAVHRAIPNYLVQMGDPQSKDPQSRAAWGLGGPGYTIPPEIRRTHTLGAVGMARVGDQLNPERRSNGSQFYITTGKLGQFDGKYTVFGQVIQGYEFLQELSELPADENDNPYTRVAIESVSLDRAGEFRPEPIADLQRTAQRKTVDEMPEQSEGAMKRLWRRIW